MDITVIGKAGLVTRTVDTVDHPDGPAKLLVATRSYDTTIDDLWSALTDADRIPRWFMPISGDLAPGGRFQLEGNAGGEILSCEPPQRFEVTWEFGGTTSWVTVQLSAEGTDRTGLELRHLAQVPDELWDQYGPGATGVGWDLALLGLDLHLSSGAAVSPEEVVSWEATPEAHAFKSEISTAWGEASIAAGADPATAKAAAKRTLAFYTGVEE
jgi:uncharacterized protein YndB with AHSA1/START domain